MLDVGHGERERRQQQWRFGERRPTTGHELVLVRRRRVSGQTEAAEPVVRLRGGEGKHHDGNQLLLHVRQQLAVLHRQLRAGQQRKQRKGTHLGDHAHRDLRVEAADAALEETCSQREAGVIRGGRFLRGRNAIARWRRRRIKVVMGRLSSGETTNKSDERCSFTVDVIISDDDEL